ncbi:vesicle-associated membrane protein [Pelomyxa schiedti]|nr:vesicle-associated membrane protein [Pelomyxa schiedti]
MSIVYGIVARADTIVAEYSPTTGTFTEITKQILGRVQHSNDHRMTYAYENFYFHFIVESGFVFLCMTSSDMPQRVAFTFLEDIKKCFQQGKYADKARFAVAFGLNEDFAAVLRHRMDFYSTEYKDEGVEIDIVQPSIESVENILEKDEQTPLVVGSSVFATKSTMESTKAMLVPVTKKTPAQLKREQRLTNLKLLCIIFFMLGTLIYFIVCLCCGGMAWQGCLNPPSPASSSSSSSFSVSKSTSL